MKSQIQRNSAVLPKLTNDLSYYDWQMEAFNKLANKWGIFEDSIADYSQNFLLVAVPGSGKSYFQIAVAKMMLNLKLIDSFIILVPWTELINQMFDDYDSFGYSSAKLSFNIKDDLLDENYNVFISSYKQISLIDCSTLKEYSNNRKVLVISDECHHLAENSKDDKSWTDAYKAIAHNALYRLSTTGTPYRSVRYETIPFVEYRKLNNNQRVIKPDFVYTRKQALKDKVISEMFLDSVAIDKIVNRNGVVLTDRNFTKTDFYQVLSPFQNSETIRYMPSFIDAANKMKSHLKEKRKTYPNAMALAIFSNIAQCEHASEYFRNVLGLDSKSIHSNVTGVKRELSRMRKTEQKYYDVICTVKMVSEGVSIKQLKVCLLWTNQQTDTIISQMLGRIVRVSNNYPYELQEAIAIYLNEPSMEKQIRYYAEEILPITTIKSDAIIDSDDDLFDLSSDDIEPNEKELIEISSKDGDKLLISGSGNLLQSSDTYKQIAHHLKSEFPDFDNSDIRDIIRKSKVSKAYALRMGLEQFFEQ